MNFHNRNTKNIETREDSSTFGRCWNPSIQAANSVPEEEKKIQDQKLDQILKNEEKRKLLARKPIKTSVKVNKPPGGTSNFSMG
jgi:hypothetical protein